MAIVKVRMLAFADTNPDGSIKIREVEIPDNEIDLEGPDEYLLEKVFYYGQNDFQPKRINSVSVGDVAELGDKLYVCASIGWREITAEEYDTLLKMERRDRGFSEIVRPRD